MFPIVCASKCFDEVDRGFADVRTRMDVRDRWRRADFGCRVRATPQSVERLAMLVT
jgi:hypothetical protein